MKTFLRNFGAAVLGWVVVAAVSFVLPTVMWMVLGPDGSFRADSWDTSTAWNAGWIIVALLGAAAGGFACSKVAADRRGLWVLIAVLVVGGALSAVLYVPAGEGMRPADVGMFEGKRWLDWLNCLCPQWARSSGRGSQRTADQPFTGIAFCWRIPAMQPAT